MSQSFLFSEENTSAEEEIFDNFKIKLTELKPGVWKRQSSCQENDEKGLKKEQAIIKGIQ